MKTSTEQLSMSELTKAADILKAIAHPVKLQILQILSEEEKVDVSTLCERVGASCEASMMSHHLAKMKDKNVLVSEKRGKRVFYSIKDRYILSLLDCLSRCPFL